MAKYIIILPSIMIILYIRTQLYQHPEARKTYATQTHTYL